LYCCKSAEEQKAVDEVKEEVKADVIEEKNGM
jgi:hypothetical protein